MSSEAPEAVRAVPDDGAPAVALPARGLPGGAIAATAAVAAVMLLVTLNARRTTAEPALLATSGTAAFPPAPPLRLGEPPSLAPRPDGEERLDEVPSWRAVDPMALRPRGGYRPALPAYGRAILPAPSPMAVPAGAAALPPPYVPGQPFRAAPFRGDDGEESGSALVIDAGRDAREKGAPAALPADDVNRPVRATLIADRGSLVGQGSVITATLETPIDSTRPGLIRAIVGEDVRGFDGRRVLIPRGTRLIGEYRADVQSGQRRVLATWTRLIRPDGVAVRVDSPAADRLGGAGIPGRVETNFLQRFATAVLQSALNVGVNLASRSNGSTVIIGPAGGAMTQVLPAPEARRTIRVAAGRPVAVFVARDLDFSGVPGWR